MLTKYLPKSLIKIYYYFYLFFDMMIEMMGIVIGFLEYPLVDDTYCKYMYKNKKSEFIASTIWDYKTLKYIKNFPDKTNAKYAASIRRDLSKARNKHLVLMFPGFLAEGKYEFPHFVKKMQKNGADDCVYLLMDPPGQGFSSGIPYDGSLYMWLFQMNYMMYFAKKALKPKKITILGHSTNGLVILVYIVLTNGNLSSDYTTVILNKIMNFAFFNAASILPISTIRKPPPSYVPDNYVIMNPLIYDKIFKGFIGNIRKYFDPLSVLSLVIRASPIQIYYRSLVTTYNILTLRYPLSMLKNFSRNAEYIAMISFRLMVHITSMSQIAILFLTKAAVPTLFLYSKYDDLVENDPEVINQIKKIYTVFELPNGHESYREEPDKISQIVTKFIKQ